MRRRTVMLVLLVLMAIGCGPRPRGSGELVPPPLGTVAKAEFYPLQPDPQSSDGTLRFRRGTAEALYVQPQVLLQAADLDRVDVVPDRDPAVRRVEITLSAAGATKVRDFAAANPGVQLLLLWENEVFGAYSPADLLAAPSIIAVGADDSLANALAAALR